jgi:hypothetical protein
MGGPIESISVKCLSLDENERCRDGSEPIPNFSDLFRLQDHFNECYIKLCCTFPSDKDNVLPSLSYLCTDVALDLYKEQMKKYDELTKSKLLVSSIVSSSSLPVKTLNSEIVPSIKFSATVSSVSSESVAGKPTINLSTPSSSFTAEAVLPAIVESVTSLPVLNTKGEPVTSSPVPGAFVTETSLKGLSIPPWELSSKASKSKVPLKPKIPLKPKVISEILTPSLSLEKVIPEVIEPKYIKSQLIKPKDINSGIIECEVSQDFLSESLLKGLKKIKQFNSKDFVFKKSVSFILIENPFKLKMN